MNNVSKQDTFDKVARHLLTQGEQSLRAPHGCAYRGEAGLMCAVGCLIPDEMYSPSMEGFVIRYPSVLSIVETLGHDLDLLDYLQEVHDAILPVAWYEALRGVALDLGLNANVLKEWSNE